MKRPETPTTYDFWFCGYLSTHPDQIARLNLKQQRRVKLVAKFKKWLKKTERDGQTTKGRLYA
jgi:hypothetical protein